MIVFSLFLFFLVEQNIVYSNIICLCFEFPFRWSCFFLLMKECCSKKTSPSVDSSWFITRLWNRGLVSVGLRKPSSVPRKTAKRPQYQGLADVPVNVFEICMTEINQTGPVSIFFCRLLYCVALRISKKIPASFPLINCRFESGML